MTATRAPLHVPAALDATLHAAVCDLRTTTRRTDGTRSAQVARWAAEIERVTGDALGTSPMSEELFRRNVAAAHLGLNRFKLVYKPLSWLSASAA
ncbi:MAG: hypothetical protein JWP74_1720 [Marmoricola sp.]|nr:hypothetical protein [Marmoricola sp.]